MYDAYLYIIANDGIDTESSYTYQEQVRFRGCVGLSDLIVIQVITIHILMCSNQLVATARAIVVL